MKVTLACSAPSRRNKDDAANAKITSEAANAEIENVAIESGRPGHRSRTLICTN